MTPSKKSREQSTTNPVLPKRQLLMLVLFGICLALALRAANRILFNKPNVLLISIDTLRPDRLGCYGFSPSPSPNIDSIASEGYLFENCYAPCSWTMPSVMSIHTGLYPFNHGLEWVDKQLKPDVQTLAELIKERNYETGAVESNLFLQSQFGFNRGFDEYLEKPIDDHRAISSPSLTDRALAWLERPRQKPFFYWIHYLDPHYDYLYHPEAEAFVKGVPETERRKEYPILELKNELFSLTQKQYSFQSQLYNGEIAFTDQHLGRLIESLKQRGQWENTWVIVTADHGEMLGEHGALGHTEWYFEPVLRVPLIIKPPKRMKQPQRISRIASLVDIVPTLMEGLGGDYPKDRLDGEDLLNPTPLAPGEVPRRWARTETKEVSFIARIENQMKCVFMPEKHQVEISAAVDPEFAEQMKALGYVGGPGQKAEGQPWLIFDLKSDPGETGDWSHRLPAVLSDFQRNVKQLLSEIQESQEQAPDEELLKMMRASGYLGGKNKK